MAQTLVLATPPSTGTYSSYMAKNKPRVYPNAILTDPTPREADSAFSPDVKEENRASGIREHSIHPLLAEHQPWMTAPHGLGGCSEYVVDGQ